MKASFVLASVAIIFFFVDQAAAQESTTAGGFTAPTAITFPDAYQPLNGQAGDLRLTLYPGKGGQIGALNLQSVTGGIKAAAVGYCTPQCFPVGKNPPDFCVVAAGCPGSPSTGPVMLSVKPVAILFGHGPGATLDVQLTQDAKTVDALSAKLQAHSSNGAANE